MSIFGTILSKIFPDAKAEPVPTAAAGAPADAPAGTATATTADAAPVSIPLGDVAAVLDAKPGAKQLNWRTSIVDLLKLLDLDSSLAARQQLAQELLYSGDPHDSAALNIWLHRQVITRLAAHGGTVPPELKH
ncbi:MAG: hypothetical protein GAK30_02095 [Paracidovorax wautersii]|uniref:DUF3597 domain-containing protein n=1 Tax=Paracidovorax wautersii TaxID=1177982 RepID=A0A7V8JQC1_9BURK|nr:MAG: hypothetical protein GAK30_02095 [Paracidovorax wautersii]